MKILAFGLISVVAWAQATISPMNSKMIDASRDNLPSQQLGIDDLIAVSVYDSPELTRTTRVEPDGTIHHVHPGVFLYLMRFGLIGVFLLFLLAWRILLLYKGMGSPHGQWVSVFFILCLGRIVAAFSGNVMMGAVDISILTGMGYICGLPAPRAVPSRDHPFPKAIPRIQKFQRSSQWGGLSRRYPARIPTGKA